MEKSRVIHGFESSLMVRGSLTNEPRDLRSTTGLFIAHLVVLNIPYSEAKRTFRPSGDDNLYFRITDYRPFAEQRVDSSAETELRSSTTVNCELGRWSSM